MSLLVRNSQTAGGLTVSNSQSVESLIQAAVYNATLTTCQASIIRGINVQANTATLSLTTYRGGASLGINASTDALTLTTFRANIAQVASLSDGTLTPGQEVTASLGGYSVAPNSVTIAGVAASIVSASTSEVVFTAPPLSDFASGEAHETTQWNTTQAVVISNGSGETASTSLQIVTPQTSGGTYWFGTTGASPYPAGSIFTGIPQGATYFVEETLGELQFLSDRGIAVFGVMPSEVTVRHFTGGSWSAITTNDFSEADGNVDAAVAELTLTAHQATVALPINVGTFPQNLVVTGQQAAIGFDVEVFANTTNLTLTEHQASLSGSIEVQANTGLVFLTEHRASVAFDREVSATTAELSLTEYRALLSKDVNASTANLTLVEYPASIEGGGSTVVNTTPVRLTLVVNNAAIGANTNINASRASLQLVSYNSSVTQLTLVPARSFVYRRRRDTFYYASR